MHAVSGTQWTGQEVVGINWNLAVPIWTSGNSFSFEGGWVIAQVSQGSCGVFIHEHIQKLFGHGPGQVSPFGTAGERGWVSDDLQRFLPTPAILWAVILWNIIQMDKILKRKKWKNKGIINRIILNKKTKENMPEQLE